LRPAGWLGQKCDAIVGRMNAVHIGARDEFSLRAGPDAVVVVRCHDHGVTKSVLIVDDHAGFRAWTRVMLERDGYAVIGEAHDGESAIASARDHRPDLVVLDVMLPDVSGLVVADRLAELPGAPSVVLVSSRDRADFGDRIARSAAIGFVPKPELSAARLRALLEQAS
jgi:DNA-binding NarL/FixJ family response regulator